MLNQFINDKNTNTALYNLSAKDVEINMPQTMEYAQWSNVIADGKNQVEFRITDKRMQGFSNVMVNLTIPEIKGVGKCRFIENFGFHLIDKIQIFSSNVQIKEMTGYEALQNYLSARGYMHTSKSWTNTKLGKDDYYYTYREGFSNDDTVWEEFKVSIPFYTTWDFDIPYSVCPVKPGDLRVLVFINPINSILVNRIAGNLQFTDYPIYTTIVLKQYGIIGAEISKKIYVEHVDTKYPDNWDMRDIQSANFDSLSSAHYRTICNNFLNKRFVCYPNGEKEYKSFKSQYERILLDDIITCIPSDVEGCEKCLDEDWNGKSHCKDCKVQELLMKKYVTADLGRYATSDVVESKAYESVKDLSKHRFVRNPDHIHIINCSNVYVLKNPLVFRRNNTDGSSTDIYQLFDFISASFHEKTNKLVIIDCQSRIDSRILSTPVEIWRDESNVEVGDLRSVKGKLGDVYLNDPWVLGLDFFGRETGYTDVSISLINTTISKAQNHGFEEIHIPYINQYFCSITNPSEDNNALVNYNFNDINYNTNIPSRILSQPDRGFQNAVITIYWKNFSKGDVFSLAKKKLVFTTVQPKCINKSNIGNVNVTNV